MKATGPPDDPRRYVLAGDALARASSGGQGFVFPAHTSSGAQVALKQLTTLSLADWPEHRRRVELVERVHHPNLATYLDAFIGAPPFERDAPTPPADEFDIPCVVTEWIEGEDLTSAVDGADLDVVLGWIRDVAHGAAALHDHRSHDAIGIVHRDIKPSNVRVTARGAVLIDLDVARGLSGASMTRAIGSAGWMAPESLADDGVIGPRSDAWQVAGLAAWAVLGVAPGSIDPHTRVRDLEAALRRRGAARPQALARHIAAGLDFDPARRPADLRRWGDELVHVAEGTAGSHRPLAAVAVAVVIAVVLAVVAVLVVGGARRSPDAPDAASVPSTRAGAAPVVVAPSTTDLVVPGPERCVAYDPGALAVQAAGDRTSVVDGAGVELTRVADVDDGQRVVSIARQYRRICSIGDADAAVGDTVVRYWRDGPATPAPVAGERCVPYDPDSLVIKLGTPSGWALWAGATELVDGLATELAAQQLQAVAAAHQQLCFIGRANPQGRDDLIVDYWR